MILVILGLGIGIGAATMRVAMRLKDEPLPPPARLNIVSEAPLAEVVRLRPKAPYDWSRDGA